jgi:hypothetical protein
MKKTKCIDVFKKVTKTTTRIEYSEKIKEAVLDRGIKGLFLNMSQGYDWIDTSNKFVLLLISRGQVKYIKSGSDLLARNDYQDAFVSGYCAGTYSICHFEVRTIGMTTGGDLKHPKNCCYASEKRILNAYQKLEKCNFVMTRLNDFGVLNKQEAS